MKKKIVSLFLAMCFLIQLSSMAYAGNLSTLVSTGVLNLASNKKWEQKYKTEQGTFKIRFRNISNSPSSKRYHLIIWWNNERVADGYCPQIIGGYAFDIYQDTKTKRLFVALKTNQRDVLMGYEPANGRLEKYADSKDYYSPLHNPRMHIDKDGDVSLAFVGNGREIPTEYKLFWVEDARWFGYKDVTYRPQPVAPESPPVYYEPVYTYETYESEDYGSSSYEGDEYVLNEEELYYEETVIVGS